MTSEAFKPSSAEKVSVAIVREAILAIFASRPLCVPISRVQQPGEDDRRGNTHGRWSVHETSNEGSSAV